MTPEQQRIAIAEACGWVHRPEHDVEFNTPAGRVAPESWRIDYPNGDCTVACEQGLPDYLNCLNAMHEAEKILKPGQDIATYLVTLCSITKQATGYVSPTFATSSQRAEAFLRTIGKWKD